MSAPVTGINRWWRHQTAISPVVEPWLHPRLALPRLWAAHGDDSEAIVAFLRHHGLAGLWAGYLAGEEVADEWRGLVAPLEQIRRGTLMLQLLQEQAMTAVAAAFEAAGVNYVFLKTAGTRRELYDDPGTRPSTDIDILVEPEQRHHARAAIESLGGVAWAQQGESAHEIAFRLGSVDIDLHWDLLAPGRLRGEVAERILRRRVTARIGWRPEDTDVLFIQLVHLAFAKHVCSPHAGLNRVTDALLALRRLQPDQAMLDQRLRQAGCANAAWASAYWIAMLAAPIEGERRAGVPPGRSGGNEAVWLTELMHRLAPSSARSAYLRQWLVNDWPGRLSGRHEWLVRMAFTLALHDAFSDAARATYRKLLRPNLAASASAAVA